MAHGFVRTHTPITIAKARKERAWLLKRREARKLKASAGKKTNPIKRKK